MNQGYTDPTHPTLAEMLQLSCSAMGELEAWAMLQGGHLISSHFPFLVSEVLQKIALTPGAKVFGQEESFKHITEKMALPRAHVADTLPEAYDGEKMSLGITHPPSLTVSRARIRGSEEPLRQICWAGGTPWGTGRMEA